MGRSFEMPSLLPQRAVFAFGACLVLALLAAACGGQDDAKPTTGTASVTGATSTTSKPTAAGNTNATKKLVDNGAGVACPLVTTAQVSKAAGRPMKDGAGKGANDAAVANCRWDGQTETATVSLDLFKPSTLVYYTEDTGKGKTDVAGIGEKARWSPLLSTLEVVQRGYYFALYVHAGVGASNDENLAAATALAANVLQSLQ